jgi:hypothetical protein
MDEEQKYLFQKIYADQRRCHYSGADFASP